MSIKLGKIAGLDPKYWISNESEKKVEISTSFSQWGTSDGTMFVPSSSTVEMLYPGVYEIKTSQNVGLYFEKIPVKTEGLINFPETNSNEVVSEIQKFWERESYFKEYELTYKRGIILYGPPGSGKSCTLQLIIADVIERKGVVVKFSDPYTFIQGMRVLRQIQPNTPVVAIMEDIDSLLDDFSETEVLNILDGIDKIEKIVFLATTNYPNKLGHRIMNRPSRFDKRFRIGFPSENSRRIYLNSIIGNEKIDSLNIDLEKWVKDTDEFSVAHLKELFIAVVILGNDYEDAIETLKSMKNSVKDSDYKEFVGFGGDSNKNDDFYN